MIKKIKNAQKDKNVTIEPHGVRKELALFD